MQGAGHHYCRYTDCSMVRTWLAAWALLALGMGVGVCQQPGNLPKGLVKTPDGYLHKPSGLRFLVPEDWEVRPRELANRYPALTLRHRLKKHQEQTIEATITLTPLEGLPLEKVLEQELKVLQLLYKEDNVSEPIESKIPMLPECTSLVLPFTPPGVGPIKIQIPMLPEECPGYRVDLREGPDLKGRQKGVLYLFSTPDKTNAWKVRLRATWNAPVSEDASKETKKLLQQFRLGKPE